MPIKHCALPISALTLLAIGCSPLVHAGGIMLYEVGSDNTGLVNAGAAARAQGPSTIASNPAGMSYLDGTQISAGAQVVYGHVKFDTDSNTNVSGSSSGNAVDPTPGASFFISQKLDDHWSVGFGNYADFGLALDYNHNWPGRYSAQYGSIGGLSFVPSVAYRFNDEWSVGIGVKAMYGMLQTQANIDQSPLGLTERSDGQYKYHDNDWGFGGNVGVIYSPQPGTRIGLAYTSQVKLKFEDGLTVHGSGPVVNQLNGLYTQLDLTVPQTATLSLYQQLDPQWALLATVNWQDWSKFGDIYANVDTSRFGAQSTTVNVHYRDTYQMAVGAQYQATQKLLWNVGLAYDTSAVTDNNRTVGNPMSSQWRLGTGATYALNHDTELNVSWDLVWMGDLDADQTKPLSGDRTSGTFTNAWLQSLTGNMTWRF